MKNLPVRTPLSQPAFLPMSREEMETLGWSQLDVLLVCGDAYVDHPSFGVPLLGRYLISHGYRVGVVCQPTVKADLEVMGRPRLYAGISAGAIDSMLAHYTAFKRKRSEDAYTPGGKAGRRPDRAVAVYARWLAEAFTGLPLVAGGIEASLRRVSHYDFWSDSVHPSILCEAPLDVLCFGMGESALLTITRRLDNIVDMIGEEAATPDVLATFDPYAGIPGTARLIESAQLKDLQQNSQHSSQKDNSNDRQQGAPQRPVTLPSHAEIIADPFQLVKLSLILERESHQGLRPLVQATGSRAVFVEPPAPPLSTQDLDALYALPFARAAHPAYKETIPANAMIRESITSHRGCGGGCAFCSLALHQGRRIASRSAESILDEVRRMAKAPRFNGSVSDVGGPSANMWQSRCTADPSRCRRESCMFPAICSHFKDDQTACVDLLRDVARLPGVRHLRVASGVRFDLALKNPLALEAYAGEFTGGQLKIAPEHCSAEVLNRMRKPGQKPFERFLQAFSEYSRAHGKEQYVIPYLMSAFPGCTAEHMHELARWLKARSWSPQQVQCFIPTPGTVATAMFYAQTDTTGQPLPVARTTSERRELHDILMPKPRHTGRPNR